MKQQEFLQLIDQYGINLNKLSITIGEVSGWEGAHGIYEKNGTWFDYSADERNHIYEDPIGNEDEAFDKMLTHVFVDLRTDGYLNKSIDEEIVKIKKEKICRFIQDTYSMSEQQANDAWAYLKQDMHVLFEFKHYVAKGSFVPDKYCYKVKGYSAEQLHTTAHLNVLEAFNYLIYLSIQPKEALATLEKALFTRIKNSSDKVLDEIQKTIDEKNAEPVTSTFSEKMSESKKPITKKQEFFQAVDDYGIDLTELSIVIGEVSGWEGDHGLYEKNGTWFYYASDERNHIFEHPIDSEDEAFDKMLRYVFYDLDTCHYLTKSIDKEIVKIKKEKICRFIQDTYSMSEQQANDAWAYLKQDMHVLFEFKHYVAKGSFVPDKYCYKVKGYSAEQLHTTAHLNVLEAFNYLVYLRLNPKEALDTLEKELSKIKNSSNNVLDAVQKAMNEQSAARATSTVSEKMSESKKPITKQQEFFQTIDDYGIDLNKLFMVIGKYYRGAGAHGIYENNGTWFYYASDGRGHNNADPIGSEDEAFDKLLIHVFCDLGAKHYLTKSIDEEIIKIKKEKICRFIQETYSMSEQQANDVWAYLKQDMHVLFEFKYYVAKGSFVPDKYCYKVKGYSAEQLHTTAHLDVLAAFNYLVYLSRNPKEALANLEKVMSRIKNSSDKGLDEISKTMDEKNTSLIAGAEQITEVLNDANVSQSELLAKLNAVQKALTDLQQSFDDKISEDTLKNDLFGNMHSEVIHYQNDTLDKIVDMSALDIIQIVDTTKNHVRVYNKKDPTEENYKELIKVVKGIVEDLEDLVYNQKIMSYRVLSHKVNVLR